MSDTGTRVIWVALIASAIAGILKYAAADWTLSSTLMAEAVHSLVAASSQVMMLAGLYRERATTPASDYFWSLVVGVLLYSLGAGVSIHEGVTHFAVPRHLEALASTMPVMIAALVATGGATWSTLSAVSSEPRSNGAIAALRASRRPALISLVFECVASLIGLAIACLALLTAAIGILDADAFGAIAVGLVQGATAAALALELRRTLASAFDPRKPDDTAAPPSAALPQSTPPKSTSHNKRSKHQP